MYRIKVGLKLDHTLTILSHPHDTMIGLAVLGENRTHEAQSVWPSSWKSLDIKAQFHQSFLCRMNKNLKAIEIKNIAFTVNSYKAC